MKWMINSQFDILIVVSKCKNGGDYNSGFDPAHFRQIAQVRYFTTAARFHGHHIIKWSDLGVDVDYFE